MSNTSTPVVAWSTTDDQPITTNRTWKKEEEEERLQVHAERNSSFLFLLTEWAENTSWGGVPNIVKKSNYIFKAMWLALVMAGLVITGIQTWQVFDRFFEYPVNINVNITHASKVAFPAVTMCNVNPMRLSGAATILPEYMMLFTKLVRNVTTAVTSEERHTMTELFQQVYNSMDYSTRIDVSHRKTDMLLDCVFNGKSCTSSDWIEWNDAVMGNCFSFNSGFKGNGTTYEQVPFMDTYRAGPNYGLAVEVYIQEEEYIQELTEMAGVKVIVHSQEVAPFPGTQGFFLQPATYSSISIHKTKISRQPHPYPSNCVIIDNAEEAKKLDAYVETFGTTYNLLGCTMSCYQAYVIRDCGCGDPKFPINAIATKRLVTNKTVTFRPCNDPVSLECQHRVAQEFAENLLTCDHCRVACSNIVYTHRLSTARWPNKAFMSTKLNQIASINSKFANYMVNATSPQNNILKFNLHFEELNYEVVYESPAYTSDSLYGDIGGVIGLWLGLSFIAVFELIQLVMDAVVLAVTMLVTRKQRRAENKITTEADVGFDVQSRNKGPLRTDCH